MYVEIILEQVSYRTSIFLKFYFNIHLYFWNLAVILRFPLSQEFNLEESGRQMLSFKNYHARIDAKLVILKSIYVYYSLNI